MLIGQPDLGAMDGDAVARWQPSEAGRRPVAVARTVAP